MNPWPGTHPHGFSDFLRWSLGDRRKQARKRARERAEVSEGFKEVPQQVISATFPRTAPDFPQRAGTDEIIATWIGHSSFLVQIGGVNILLDPVWGERASPVGFAGPKRHMPPGVSFDVLPPIDLVVLSHDHYDHLDLYTVRRLLREHPETSWIAPLGVGAWLAQRGAKIIGELDWWDSVATCGLEITCVPAQHFSGRSVTNRNGTLWCGWVVRSGSRAIFYAGDTGYHPEFEAITDRLGPFDAAFIPIGAYEPRWFMRPVHVAPEEAIDAYRDIVRANGGHPCTFVAMHWGTFKLTDEPLDEPPVLTRELWRAAGLDPALLWIPRHGETRRLSGM